MNDKKKLSSEERQESICHHIEKRGKISVAALAEIFSVSMQTIRRDLKILKSENKLAKIHGKAVKHNPLYEPMFNERLEKNYFEKKNIGEFAASLLGDNDTFACDSTTTVYSFLKEVQNLKNVTIALNSFVAVQDLQRKFAANSLTGKIFFLGGIIDFSNLMTYGPDMDEEIGRLYFDKAFIGAGGVSIEHGLTAFSDRVGHIAGKLIDHAREVILLVDQSKIGKRTLYSFARLDRIDKIITTIEPPDEQWRRFIEQGRLEWTNVRSEFL